MSPERVVVYRESLILKYGGNIVLEYPLHGFVEVRIHVLHVLYVAFPDGECQLECDFKRNQVKMLVI